jgi:glycolate oxidase FAD binding subunit
LNASSLPKPSTSNDVIDAIADAVRADAPLEIRGGGSKAAIGAPRNAPILDMSGFDAVIDYDPAELVLTAGAGTPLSVISALVESENQMLAFEPFDHGPLLGQVAGAATIGGVIAAGVAGSRRVSGGGARDHLLGFEGISGRGERFVAGAKVVKNVTGYDLPKLAAGSWGRLFAMTQLTLKVLPRGRESATCIVEGLSPTQAVAAMARAMGSQADVSAAAYLPAALAGGASLTALRVEGFGPSVAARCTMIEAALAEFGAVGRVDAATAGKVWADLRTLAPLAGTAPLWRIATPPSTAPSLVAALEPFGAQWLFDWAGGLTWLTLDGDPARVRAAAAAASGHAILVRAPEAMRRIVPALHPQANGVAALEARVRRAFDPNGVFETGRFHEVANAN